MSEVEEAIMGIFFKDFVRFFWNILFGRLTMQEVEKEMVATLFCSRNKEEEGDSIVWIFLIISDAFLVLYSMHYIYIQHCIMFIQI